MYISGFCTTPDGRFGVCQSFFSCSSLATSFNNLRFLSQPQRDAQLQFLRQSICNIISGTPYGCCPNVLSSFFNNNPFINIQPQIPAPAPPPPTEPPKRGRNLLPRSCGLSRNSNRIVGGIDAQLGDWPWMVLFFGRQGNWIKFVFDIFKYLKNFVLKVLLLL